MTTLQTVREIALEQPASIRVFEKFGIDYCCNGRKPLAEACSAANIEISAVLEALERSAVIPIHAGTDWTQASLERLVRHIVHTHHAYVLAELPRLGELAQKVVNRHGDTQPHLPALQRRVALLTAELTSHLAKEETILFPYIIELERAQNGNTAAPKACFSSVDGPIATMMAEHDDAGALLAEIKDLSNSYTPPVGACPTYVGYYTALKEFEQDLHQHIHLENNILFPRAAELERNSVRAV
jgi:regulator of cell morphogenesis and NO signaling